MRIRTTIAAAVLAVGAVTLTTVGASAGHSTTVWVVADNDVDRLIAITFAQTLNGDQVHAEVTEQPPADATCVVAFGKNANEHTDGYQEGSHVRALTGEDRWATAESAIGAWNFVHKQCLGEGQGQ